ncbi:MAG: serine/threonine protein kinase [Prosthecobacter sp.]|jgi:tetratricopeptide (TPR) repeat protein|uniref:serine/threonine-protein kinase n=1 Tax=Prosthecobacter sp. TaxID=1965333 RepID=UPI001A06DCCE|nr:serine/threonine-protein kinase [Prosthecobacter sp.]MBE2284896.1 serine/threonine protein kinase [Prosthecobacter sp.]
MQPSTVQSFLSPFGWDQRFELLERVGAGAMGQVWRAREVATDRVVALKLLDSSRMGDEQALARLEVEGETLTKLREAGAHESVVPILDFQIRGGHFCLVMEFIPGLDLRKWCATHRLGLQERVKLMVQAARAAGWFHGLGVVHRDLKPANILVSAVTHQPVIVDFSIAKVENELTLTLTNEALGTVHYMAPEQFDRRRSPISPATDVYALGATLYELLTDVPPHPGEFTVVVQRHNDERAPARPSALNPAIPRDLECILLKALAHRPTDRYANGTELADDLELFLKGHPVRARHVSRITQVFRWARRKPALAATMVACLALTGFAAWNGERAVRERQRRELEARLAESLVLQKWSRSQLQAAEADLARLALLSPDSADHRRSALLADVSHDIFSALRQTRVGDEQWTWMVEAIEWLRPHDRAEAGRLTGLLDARRGGWRSLADLHPPFTHLQGLFPRSHVRVSGEDGLLHPEYDGPPEQPATITVMDTLRTPAEVTATFSVPESAFRYIGMGVTHLDSRVDVAVYKTGNAPQAVKKAVGVSDPDPGSFILYLSHNRSFQTGCHIPDTALLQKPFTLALRVNQNRAEAVINGVHSVKAENLFLLSSATDTNWCRLYWPKAIGLQALSIRQLERKAISPLEEADLLASQGRWQDAQRHFEELTGAPDHGVEARYKLAAVHIQLKEYDEAARLWEGILAGPPSPWRDFSAYHLWVRTATTKGLTAAAAWLENLPGEVPSHIIRSVDPQSQVKLINAYRRLGAGSGLLNSDPREVLAAAKALRLLGCSNVDIANRCAFSFHQASLDDGARRLLMAGLDISEARRLSVVPADHLAALNCLALWCRISPSEKDSSLAARLGHWRNEIPNDPTVRCLTALEGGRRAARAGDLSLAAAGASTALKQQGGDTRLLTSAGLFDGMVCRLQGDEEAAQAAWRRALDKATAITMRSPLHLCDRVILHTLTQTWDKTIAHEVISDLISRNVADHARSERQGLFLTSFLADPDYIDTLNALFTTESGRQLARDYALCTLPPRELHRRFYQLMFGQYFRPSGFSFAGEGDDARLPRVVAQLVEEMTNPRASATDLFALIRGWNDPGEALSFLRRDYPANPSLMAELKWLLRLRHSSAEGPCR